MKSSLRTAAMIWALAAAQAQAAQPAIETVQDRVATISNETRKAPDVVAHSDKYGLQGELIRISENVELFVIQEGEGEPLVLLNGGPGNSLQSFIPHFSRAAEFSRVIYYDPRGVGRSSWDPGPDGYSTRQAIGDLESLREELGIEHWTVLGWSWGGLLAQHYALEHPGRIRGLALIASSESMGLERDEDIFVNNLSDAERARIRRAYSVAGNRVVPTTSDSVGVDQVRTMVFNAYLNGDWKRQFYYRPSRERMAHVAQHEWRHDANYNAQMGATGFARDLSGAFDDLQIPVLLINGAWDMTFSREMPARLAAQFPSAELHVLAHSSHNPFASEPDLFFDLLQRWFENLPAP